MAGVELCPTPCDRFFATGRKAVSYEAMAPIGTKMVDEVDRANGRPATGEEKAPQEKIPKTLRGFAHLLGLPHSRELLAVICSRSD